MTHIRLNKALAHAGVCSRRKADELVEAGRVSINGITVNTLGAKVSLEEDTIAVDGKEIFLSEKENPVYLLLHKPIQVVSTASDPQGRPTVLDILPEKYSSYRLYPVGRLDYFSEGLLLLTNDGELTHRLTHPRYHLKKVYAVTIRETPSNEDLTLMRKGMVLAEGEKLAPVGVQYEENILYLTLHQGINRQIRRMCRDLNVTILKLQRLSIGDIQLGELPPGAVRPLSQQEIHELKKAVGL